MHYLVCQALHQGGLAGAGFSYQQSRLLLVQGDRHSLEQPHGMPCLSKTASGALHSTSAMFVPYRDRKTLRVICQGNAAIKTL